MEQFSRTELLIGPEGLKRLQKASVTVIGLGAVGSYCVEALARAGVGKFCLVDFDIIRPSNINRHLWAFHSTVNIPKSEMAAKRVFDINPKAHVDARTCFADQETMVDILKSEPDIVVDAIDALNPKAQVLESCWRAGVPTFSSMGAATRMDPFSVRTADVMDTTMCPLAKRIRQMLKDRGVGKGIRCVYSLERRNIDALSPDSVKDAGELPRGRARRKMGSLSTLTGLFGLILAHMVITALIAPSKKN